MDFHDIPYQRVTFEEIAASYDAPCSQLQAVRSEDDCRGVLNSHYRLTDPLRSGRV